MNRKEIISKIIEEQQKVINNLEQSVDRYRTASDLDEDNTSDPDDLARQGEAKDMQLRFEQLLNEANQKMAFLDSEKEAEHSGIENGSLVETDKNYLFIGVSLQAFEVEGKQVLSFSEDAPVYAGLKDKKVDDVVKIGDQSYRILSVQ